MVGGRVGGGDAGAGDYGRRVAAGDALEKTSCAPNLH